MNNTRLIYREGSINYTVVSWPWLDRRRLPRCSTTALLSNIGGLENKAEKNLVAQDKGSLMKQNSRVREEAKENKRLLTSCIAGDVLPLLRNWGFSMCSSCCRRKNVKITNAPLSLLLSLSFSCWAYVIWYEISLEPVLVSSLGYVLSEDLVYPSLLAFGDEGAECWRDSLDTV